MTKEISSRLKRNVCRLPRKYHHRIIHHIHRKHKISYKTLFYMKEYGPRSHVSHVILRESIKVLIPAAVLSSVSGAVLNTIEEKLVAFLPLLILLPALNTLVGNFGTIISSKFTTMLYLRKIYGRWWESHKIHRLLLNLFLISFFVVIYITGLSSLFAVFRGFEFSSTIFIITLQVAITTVFSLVALISVISIVGGFIIYRRNEDPNNFLIPITTSIADFGTILIFSFLILQL